MALTKTEAPETVTFLAISARVSEVSLSTVTLAETPNSDAFAPVWDTPTLKMSCVAVTASPFPPDPVLTMALSSISAMVLLVEIDTITEGPMAFFPEIPNGLTRASKLACR